MEISDKRILICDSGATKAAWAVVAPSGAAETVRVTTRGINAVALPPETIAEIINGELLGGLSPEVAGAVAEIRFYGAGCIDPEACRTVAAALRRAFPGATAVEVASDMVGAASAVCGNRPGVACILGTGSNSCLWDGTGIVENVPPLGFILGDEGSGAVLGKRLIADIFKGVAPRAVAEEWRDEYVLDMAAVVRRVYREPAPAAFLASFAPFIRSHLHVKEIEEMVVDEFARFFRRNVARYTDARRLPIHFVGSIAAVFEAQLKQAADFERFNIGKIVDSPIELLIVGAGQRVDIHG